MLLRVSTVFFFFLFFLFHFHFSRFPNVDGGKLTVGAVTMGAATMNGIRGIKWGVRLQMRE